MGGYDGEIRIDTKLDTKGFNTGVGNIGKSLGKVFAVVSKLAVAVGIAFGIGQVVNFGKTAVQAASDLSSAMVGLQSIMDGQGRSFANAEKFITDYIKDGLIPASNAITAYKNLASRGYDTSQIEQTLIALKDASAFGRQASYSMGEAVQTATEGLKNENSILVDNAGVTKNVAQMWKEYAASIGTTVSSLTKQQKIEAEVNGILEETKFQTGDAAKAAGTYAGVNQALSASFTNFKVAIGNIFIPLLMKIIPVVTQVINWLTVLANKAAQVINLLLGTNISVASSGMDQLAGGTQAAADAQGDLAKQTDKANKAAKGALASFDELNVLQMDEGDAGGGGAGAGVDIGAGIGGGEDSVKTAIDDAEEAIKDFVARVKEYFAELFAPLQEPWDNLKSVAAELGGTIWDGLTWVWENILKPLGEWIIQEAAPVFIDLLASALGLLNTVLLALQPMGLWLWENFLQPIAEWTGQAFLDALGWVTDRLNELSDWISTHQTAFENIIITIAAFAAGWLIVNVAMAAWAAIGTIATAVTTAFGAAVAFLTSPVFLVALAIGALIAIIVLLIKNWDWVKEKAAQVWTTIKQIWYLAGWWFQTKIIDPIKEGFKTGLDWIKTKWEETFTGIKDFVKGIINSIIDFINGMISGIATGINAVIGALNSIKIDIPPILGKPGYTFGLNLPPVVAPQIPRLATGAVIPPNSEFMAILGDQKSGRNIETPEALLRQIVQEELGNIQADISIGFTGSLGALVRELKPHIDRENVRIGGSLVKGGATL